MADEPTPVDPRLRNLFSDFDGYPSSDPNDASDDDPGDPIELPSPTTTTTSPIYSAINTSQLRDPTPTNTNILDLDTPTPTRRPGRRLTAIQKDQVARLMVAGVPRSQISAAYGVSTDTIATWEKDESGEWEHRRGVAATALNRAMVDLIYGMHARLPDALLSLDNDGLHCNDSKVRLETAKYVIGYAERYHTSQQKVAQSTQLAQVNNQINVDTSGIVEATKQVADVLLELRGSKLGGLGRVKTGPEGLPGPSAISELASATQTPEPTADQSTVEGEVPA